MKKKSVLAILISILGVGCCLLIFPRLVFASAGDIGDGLWLLPESNHSFITTNVDVAAKTAPEWLQQLSEGVVINQGELICYPFRGGQFHWVPQIMQAVDNEWLPLLTTQKYLDGVEASPYACAKSDEGGTFALFGYYDGPIEQPVIETTEETEVIPPIDPPLECPPDFLLVGDSCIPAPSK